ncbi:hypothetical protein [Francisella sp. XLW-1]|uniref:hypothetical protein n=1 Tax=Francisella sp. XLW-1 TaxID=2610887 RepID=UPI00123D295F|nr:hypothetical protein [Francisella sp. XLW-1]
MRKRFIITCHGWSASNWLAYVLSQHQNIIVSHSAANLLDEKLSNDIRDKLKKFHQGYKNRQDRAIDESYDFIEAYDDAKFYGSVHLYRLRDLPIQYEKFGNATRKFNVVNLIRNPIDLVWSGYGQFKDLFKTDINELYWTTGKILEDKDFIYYLNDKYNLLVGDYENLAFIGAARVLGSLRLDLDAMKSIQNIPFINYMGEVKMEDVTSKPEILKALILKLTNNEVDVTDEYLNNLYKIGEINKHKQDDKKLTPKERFESLKDWQKETLLYYLNKYNIIKPYEDFGYNLSFLHKGSINKFK